MKILGSKEKNSQFITSVLQRVVSGTSSELYIEPFVGGANIINKIRCARRIGYDNSIGLIALLNKGITNFAEIPKEMDRDTWEVAKEEYCNYYKNNITPTYDWWLIGAVQYFASLGAGGFLRGYANPYKKRDYYKESYNNFRKQIPSLRGIEFYANDYREIDIPANSVVYCDPPYKNSKTNLYKFQEPFDYDVYWDYIRKISMDSYVVCSEESIPDDFIIIKPDTLLQLTKCDDFRTGKEKLVTYEKGKLSGFDFR